MASAIFNALARGYSARQIINWLLRHHPQHATQINNALAAGYTAQQILQHLTEGKEKNVANSDRYYTDYEKAQKNYDKTLRNARAGAIGALGTAGALIGGLMALRSGQMPQTGQPAPNAPQPAPNAPQPAPNAPQPAPNAPQPTPNAPQPTQPQPQPPQPPQTTQYNAQSAHTILTSLNQLQRVQNMNNAGNNADVIASTIALTMQPDEKKAYKEALKNGEVPPLRKLVEDYLAENPPQQAIQPTSQPPTPPPTPEPQTQTQQPQQPQPQTPEAPLEQKAQELEPEAPKEMTKGTEVVTPKGIGTIKSMSDKKALIDVDGTTVQVDKNDMSHMPMPKKDLADLLEDLHRGIEEETGEEVSRMVQYAAYNPDINRLAFLGWEGDMYIFDNLKQQHVDRLNNMAGMRKTTGNNFIGGWIKDTKSPIGAELSKLLKEIQEDKKQELNEKRKEIEKTAQEIGVNKNFKKTIELPQKKGGTLSKKQLKSFVNIAGVKETTGLEKLSYQMPQKEKEYSAKLQTIYNPHEPALEAKKRKYKEQKKLERENALKEKPEKKRRKKTDV